MLKERSQSFKLLFILFDFVISLVSFAAAFYARYFVQDSGQFYFQEVISIESYLALAFAISVTQIIAFLTIDLYHPRRGVSYADEFLAIAGGVILNLLILLSLVFFFRGESFSRLVIIYYTILNTIFTTAVHLALRTLLRSLRKKGYNIRRVLVLGTGSPAVSFARIVSDHQIYGYRIIGFISAKTVKKSDLKILGDYAKLNKILSRYKPDIVVYAFTAREGDYVKSVIDICDNEGIDIKIIPDYHEFITAKGRVEEIDGLPVISIRNIPVRLGYNKVIKRTFDIAFSLFSLLAFSPVFIIIPFLIKITSRGPVFITQERVGLDNKKFGMLKFRSMYVQAKNSSDTVWTVKNDPRVTWIGRFLRKYSVDEIPQFLNVLFGDMSVVGPRPERPFYVKQFKTEHHHYMRRHAVKAGITGWAQVQGLRGDTSIEKRIEADIFYIENWSLLFDIKIILLTPFKGVFNQNAY